MPSVPAGWIARLFRNADDASVSLLSASARVKRFERRQVLVRSGDTAGVLLLIEGHAALVSVSAQGKQVIRCIVGSGDLAGLPALGEDLARPADRDVIGLTHGTVLEWDSVSFRRVLATDPGFAMDVLAHALRVMEDQRRRFDAMACQDAATRLADALITHADLAFDATRPCLTRTQLAELIGTTREMAGRVLREFEACGAVRRRGRTGLILVDADKLRELTRAGKRRSEPVPLSPLRS